MSLLPLWGFLDTLIDAFDWSKLAVPAGTIAVITLAFYVARKIAQREVVVQIRELESKLKSEAEAHEAARKTIDALRLQQAAHASTMESQLSTIKKYEKQIAQNKSDYDKVFSVGQRHYKEILILREDKKEHDRLKIEHVTAMSQIKILEDSVIGQDDKLKVLRDDLDQRLKEMEQAERRMRKAQRLSGYLIKARAMQARPKFRPLQERQRAIIAVAALKGGVGKTTLTAHLAGALARKGYRVLLLDLDLQGSLTGLMLPPDTIVEQVEKKRLIQDFFIRAMEDKAHKLTEYTVRSPHLNDTPGSIDIVPTSDRLSYAELNLTLGWLLKQGKRDARFLLRKALHQKLANSAYDIVLLDCPPVLNISCANAFAAADYLLIPTLLSTKSIERVPILINSVQEEHFLKHLNSQLKILGVVANRTRFADPRGQESVNWSNFLPHRLASIQNQHTKLFTTIVAQDAEISSNEESYTLPKVGGRAHVIFTQLLTELEQEIPDVCRRTVTANS